MKKFNPNTLLIIILPIIFGFLAGILGVSFLGSSNLGLPFWGRLNVSNINSGERIVIDQPRNVIVEQDLQIKQLENSLLPALMNVYLKVKDSNDPIQKAYSGAELLGQGFALTSNGWIITNKSVIANSKEAHEVIGYQNKNYLLGSYIEDAGTGIVFAKADSQNLTVANIGRSKDLIVGQTVAIVSQRGRVELTHISKIGYNFKNNQELLQSSESYNKEIFIDMTLDKSHNGGVLTNLKGDVVGIINEGRIIPSDYFKEAINQVLGGQKIVRPKLGVNYLDLSQTDGLIQYGDKGALIAGPVLKESPSFNKLKEGDIIKKVNDAELNSFQSLSELLLNYKPGNKVDLTVLRSGKEISIEVFLK